MLLLHAAQVERTQCFRRGLAWREAGLQTSPVSAEEARAPEPPALQVAPGLFVVADETGGAGVSVIVCARGAGMWVGRCLVDEEFGFAPGVVGRVGGISDEVESRSWWGSSGGKLKLLKVDYPADAMRVGTALGYQRNVKG